MSSTIGHWFKCVYTVYTGLTYNYKDHAMSACKLKKKINESFLAIVYIINIYNVLDPDIC